MNKVADWAIPVRIKMMQYGIRNHDIAQETGKSVSWISNILTGYRQNEHMKETIIESVNRIAAGREKQYRNCS
ncbi:hypothetical protein LJC32_02815 [Oscillospiraceae bacterium OttesenSCG-928-F05]|nr:hypothetical protein [Oscillospiraceae bacterium OttesenSCG-928-F05]